MKGIIALDIDGTITNDIHSTPPKVVDYLHSLAESGWVIVFATGRSFSMAHLIDQAFTFPHYLALYNGAQTISMPEKKIVSQEYLDFSILIEVEKILQNEDTDCVVYTGMENNDICYWRPSFFSSELQDYLRERAKIFKEEYREKEDFSDLMTHGIVALKCYGTFKTCEKIAERAKNLPLHITIVQDPIKEGMYVLVLTAVNGDKGKAIKKLKEIIDPKCRVIAAGNDLNDISMLLIADISCVINSAPQKMKDMADIIAPGVEEFGVITALKKAIGENA